MTKSWKRHELRTAKRLGGVRTGNRGRAAADVTTPWASIECKERATLPAWLVAAMGQAVAGAVDGQVPLLVLHTKGAASDNDLVIMRLGDFLYLRGVAWTGSGEDAE